VRLAFLTCHWLTAQPIRDLSSIVFCEVTDRPPLYRFYNEPLLGTKYAEFPVQWKIRNPTLSVKTNLSRGIIKKE
jgi:hypothetical protein